MGPHGILDAGVGIVGVVHRNVAVAVAQMGGGNGRLNLVIRRVDGGAAVVLVLVVFICWRRRLARVVPGHLGAAVVSSRGAGRGRVGIRLPLLVIHGISGHRGRADWETEQEKREREMGERAGRALEAAGGLRSDELQRQR